jgi:WD40 repeat protein
LNLRTHLVLAGHKRGVWDAAFHEIEQLIVTVAGDGMIKGWNLLNGDCLWSMGEGLGLVRCQFIYHNQVVTGSLDGIIKIWDIRKKTSLSYDKHEGKIWALDVRKNE